MDKRSKMFYIANMNVLASLSPLDFGRAYRAERRALGRTQQEVAEAAGCRRQTIADLEAGRNVSLHTLFAALAVLGKAVLITDARPDLDHLHLLADPEDEN
ncbi:helix-turn-helix transcriptional regulator [Stenotrophomonas sp. NPDC047960]|uniref:helix-turn-helix transcriptional regulator n=1 Tax=Stenotrophomonas sp. NPDC047960 TaxID=3364531 RepID=UPI0037182943